jgi:hypothetical protein
MEGCGGTVVDDLRTYLDAMSWLFLYAAIGFTEIGPDPIHGLATRGHFFPLLVSGISTGIPVVYFSGIPAQWVA